MADSYPIYMDYHATTPVDPRVLDAMMPFFNQTFGNAAAWTMFTEILPSRPLNGRGK